MTKNCPSCALSYPDSSEFCDECGRSLESGVATPLDHPANQGPKPQVSPTPAPPTSTSSCTSCAWSGPTPADGFCPECGSKVAPRTGQKSDQKKQPGTVPAGTPARLGLPDGSEVNMDTFPFEFGRANVSRLPESKFVSGQHLRFTRQDRTGDVGYFVEDTGSLNGSSVNGKVLGPGKHTPSKEPVLLHDGDTLGLAMSEGNGKPAVTLTFRMPRPQPAP